MLYDYYYSEAHEAHMKAMHEVIGEVYADSHINGIKYTEMIEQGKRPHTAHFGDIKKVFTGKHILP